MKFKNSGEPIDINIDHCIIAGWTGRDKQAVQHHIAELAVIGITPPTTVPLYYQVSSTQLTQRSTIEVLGEDTSGEVEPLLLQKNGELWIGLASDHTDRHLEVHSVAASKQICLKPVASELWRFDDIKDHIDSLKLRCSIKENGEWVIYQEGGFSNIQPLANLIKGSGFTDNTAMLCGTLSAIGGVRPALEYKMEMEDAVRAKTITLEYKVNVLPVIA